MAKKKNNQKKKSMGSITDLSKKMDKVLALERQITGSNKASKQVKKAVVKQAGGIHPYVGQVLERFLNPHDRAGPKVGLPTFPNFPSMKARGYVDFTMVTGSAGYGFVSVNPSLANDTVQVNYSSATNYAGTTVNAMNAGAVGTSTTTVSNLPFATAQFGGSMRGRIVAVGLSFKSTTAPLYTQGVVQTLVEPSHSSIAAYTVANMSSRSQCETRNVIPNAEYHLTMQPTSATDPQYTATVQQWYGDNVGVIGGVLVSGASTVANQNLSFFCRLTVDVEIVGNLVENLVSPNPVAPPGALEHVIDIAQKVHAHKVSHPGKISPQQMVSYAKTAYKVLNSPEGKAGIAFARGVIGL